MTEPSRRTRPLDVEAWRAVYRGIGDPGRLAERWRVSIETVRSWARQEHAARLGEIRRRRP